MAFQGLKIFETDEEEAERLGTAPEGSQAHHWSTLPVTVKGDPRGMVLKLPVQHGGTIIVVPHTFAEGSRSEEVLPRRHDGSWHCIVVHSDVEPYAVGGWDLSISEHQIRRSERVTF